ncbi:VWA domain-containing protein [Streptomyces sp. NPDC090025]|uniref:VWA domain-containing protein n=1 Tax=Streptomyces sp. NPDC090025 TaxID=3365922 RepID=UPI00383443B2
MGIRSLLRKVFGRDRTTTADPTPQTAASVPAQASASESVSVTGSVPESVAVTESVTVPESREEAPAVAVAASSSTPAPVRETAAARAAADLVAASFDNPQIPGARREDGAASPEAVEPVAEAVAEPVAEVTAEPVAEAVVPVAAEAAEADAPDAAEPVAEVETVTEVADEPVAVSGDAAGEPEEAAATGESAPQADDSESPEPVAETPAEETPAEPETIAAAGESAPQAETAVEAEQDLTGPEADTAAVPAEEEVVPAEEATTEPAAQAAEPEATPAQPEPIAAAAADEAPAATEPEPAPAQPETAAAPEPVTAKAPTPAQPETAAAPEPVAAKAPAPAQPETAAATALRELNLDPATARATTYLVIDRSGSMRPYFKDGSVQRLAEQTMALAEQLADPGEEATVTAVFFSTDIDGTATLTRADLTPTRVEEINATLGRLGRTNYHRAVEEVLALHDKSADPSRPALVVFQTDGAPESKTAATQALTEAAERADREIHWRFTVWGEEDAKAFDYLRKLATPRTAVHFAGPTPAGTPDAEFYRRLLAGWSL